MIAADVNLKANIRRCEQQDVDLAAPTGFDSWSELHLVKCAICNEARMHLRREFGSRNLVA